MTELSVPFGCAFAPKTGSRRSRSRSIISAIPSAPGALPPRIGVTTAAKKSIRSPYGGPSRRSRIEKLLLELRAPEIEHRRIETNALRFDALWTFNDAFVYDD